MMMMTMTTMMKLRWWTGCGVHGMRCLDGRLVVVYMV